MMRLALMFLAILGIVAVVTWMRRPERPKSEGTLESQQRRPDEPVRYIGVVRQVLVGESSQPLAPPRIETLEQRIERNRDTYRQLYPDLGEVLRLDAKAASDLYYLLAKQSLESSEGLPAETQDRLAAEHDAQIERMFGEHAFRRFELYREMPASRDVSRLNGGLDESQRIRGEALWRLVQLMHDNSIYGAQVPGSVSSFQALPPEVEGSPRSQALIWLGKHEDHFRMQERWRQRIEAEAAGFLTPVQFDALKRSHAETSSSWRRGLEQSRAEAGLTPAVPETPEPTLLGVIRRRIPIEGEIKSRLTVTVNGHPIHREHTGPNRERFGFQAGSGLWVEAIPTLYDDGWFEMLLAYSETRRGKRRQLDQWVEIGSPTRQPNGAPSVPHDSLSETKTGRMVYEIRPTGITASAVERAR